MSDNEEDDVANHKYTIEEDKEFLDSLDDDQLIDILLTRVTPDDAIKIRELLDRLDCETKFEVQEIKYFTQPGFCDPDDQFPGLAGHQEIWFGDN